MSKTSSREYANFYLASPCEDSLKSILNSLALEMEEAYRLSSDQSPVVLMLLLREYDVRFREIVSLIDDKRINPNRFAPFVKDRVTAEMVSSAGKNSLN